MRKLKLVCSVCGKTVRWMLYEGDRCEPCFRANPPEKVVYNPPPPRLKAAVPPAVRVLVGRMKAEKQRRKLTLRELALEVGLHRSMMDRLLALDAGYLAYEKAEVAFPPWLEKSEQMKSIGVERRGRKYER